MTTFPTPQPDQGATNPPDPDPSATASGNDGSGDLSPEIVAALVTLARVLDPDACDPPAKSLPIGDAAEVWRRQDAALLTARRVWEAGYRLVSEDAATLDRVARAIAMTDSWLPLPEEIKNDLRRRARAAVRALREAGQ